MQFPIAIVADANDDMNVDLNYEMEDEDGPLPHNSTSEDSSWENARFLLRVTQEQSLTYDGIEKLCDSVQDFTEVLTDKMAHQMKEKLTDLKGSNIDKTITQELLSICKHV